MGTKNERKKELINEYKERKTAGGVYKIYNTVNNRYLLASGTNLESLRNRFEFSQNTGSCVMPLLKKDWDDFGAKAFAFEILEEIEMRDNQTIKEFQDDLNLLHEIWAEKFDTEKSY